MKKTGITKGNLRVVFTLSILVLISVNLVTYMNADDRSKTEKDIAESYKQIALTEKINSHLAEAQASRRGYYISSDREFLDDFNNSINGVDSTFHELKVTFEINPIQMQYLDTLDLLIRQRKEFYAKSIDEQQKRKISLSLLTGYTGKGQEVQNKIKSLINRMKEQLQFDLNNKIENSKQGAKFTTFILAGGTLTGIIIFLIIFILLMKQKSDPENYEITREELELIIRDRTAEISQINQKLYKEISKHVEYEKALKQSEQDYRKLFEQAHDAILVISPEEDIILDVNQCGCELYGISKDKFIGMSLKSVSKNVPDIQKHFSATVGSGFQYNFQAVQYKSDGSEMLMEINSSVVNYKGKQSILSIIRDITYRITHIDPYNLT